MVSEYRIYFTCQMTHQCPGIPGKVQVIKKRSRTGMEWRYNINTRLDSHYRAIKSHSYKTNSTVALLGWSSFRVYILNI